MPLLDVDNLHTHFFTREGVVKAVDGISFTVEAGKTLGIVGESGCGKSVTALSLMGLIPKPPARIVEGSVTFQGRDLTTLSERELEDVRGREMAMIFQDPMTSLNPTLRIKTQITEVLDRHFGYSKEDARRRAVELLEEVQIPRAAERLDDYPHRFSGGMRQRVMIAIAIACNPKLLIADEPTTALDVTVQAEILDLLEELRREHEMGMIIITHDMGVVAETADDVAVMYAGQFVEQAGTQELFDRPEHPYTEALLGALPQLEGENIRFGRLRSIPGRPPDLIAPPEGCRFAPRCPVRKRGRRLRRDAAGAPADPAEPPRSLPASGERAGGGPGMSAGEDGALLQVRDLRKEFPVRSGFLIERVSHTVNAVDGVSFEIEEGKTLGLVGESGSGKSTTGYCILQLLKPTAGSIRFQGEELTELGREAIRKMRREMQIVFQDPYSSLDPRMTVGDIVSEPLEVHSVGSRRNRRARVRELLDVVGFNPDYENRYPHEFSGGQRQRVGVARALALNPSLIVCDEPVSALDVSIQAQILNLLKDLQRDFGLTYLFISHDLAVVRSMSDHIAVMKDGKIVETGSADDVYETPKHEYTRALLTAVPVPDPRKMRERRIERRKLHHVIAET